MTDAAINDCWELLDPNLFHAPAIPNDRATPPRLEGFPAQRTPYINHMRFLAVLTQKRIVDCHSLLVACTGSASRPTRR